MFSIGCRERESWQKRYEEGEQALRNGNSKLAIDTAKSGYEALRKRDPLMAWRFRVLQAQALSRQRRSADSLAVIDAAGPPILPDELLAETNIARGNALCGLNRNAEGAALLENTEGIASRSPTLESAVKYALADCTSQESATAAKYLQSSARLAHGKDGYLEARALVLLGYFLMQDGRYDEAIGILNQAVAVTESPWLKELAFGNIGYSLERLGDWRTAPDYLRRAEELASTVADASSDRALWLVDLGQQYFSQLQYSEAEKAWSKALAIARQLNDPVRIAQCLNNLAILALSRSDAATAENFIQDSKTLQLADNQRFDLLLTEAKLAKYRNNHDLARQLMARILASHPDTEARYNTLTELAILNSEEGRTADADKMFQEGIVTAEQAFARVASEKFRISFMDHEPFYDAYVHFLVNQNRPLDALNVAERARSGALAAALEIDRSKELQLKSIQKTLLSRGQVVLAYWLAQKESYLWVITAREMKLLKIAPEMEIVGAIDEYAQQVLDISTADESALGAHLYTLLVAPGEKHIPKGSQVIIVPHRRLYKLNFETLVVPTPRPHFWIEDVCVQNASFLGMLAHPHKTQARFAKDLLLMGAPLEASKDFPTLTHAKEELTKVAAHFQAAQERIVDGRQATPEAYRDSDPRQFRFFHFVTHGTASDTNPLDSAIILSPSDHGFKLYAWQIIKTKIHPELVTISTCYGAGTRQYSGEGLVGLAWAFMRVGAHQVVAALWEVDDAANADFMDQFYSELTHGKAAAVALRDSKLAMLHSTGPRKRPYYWASLQLYTGP